MKSFNIIHLSVLVFLLLISSCKDNDPIVLVPFAKFTTPSIQNGEVTFRNYSLNSTSYFWDFDDGNTSTEKDPMYEYLNIGTYNVTLTASDGVNSDTYSLIVAIGQVYPSNLMELDNLPFGVSGENLSFTNGGKGYVGGGIQDGNFMRSQNLWEFDPTIKEWTLISQDMPSDFTNGVSFAIGEEVYMGLGTNLLDSHNDGFFKYSITNNSFVADTDFPMTTSNGRITDAAHFSFGGKGYVMGVNQYQNSGKDIFEYNPTNQTWISIGEFPFEANSGMMYFLLGEKLYIGMGNVNSFSSFSNSMDFWEFNLVTKAWSQKSNFPGESRRDGIGFTYDGHGYLGFGLITDPITGSLNPKSDLWKYDHINDTWEKIADFPIVSKYELFAFVFGDSLFFGGGISSPGNYVDNFWEYQLD